MEWSDDAIVLSVRPHGETSAIVEALTRKRAAQAFAANGFIPDQIYVNVQALSGAPANNAVIDSVIKPPPSI